MYTFLNLGHLLICALILVIGCKQNRIGEKYICNRYDQAHSNVDADIDERMTWLMEFSSACKIDQGSILNHYSQYYPSLWDVVDWCVDRDVYVVAWRPIRQSMEFNSLVAELHSDNKCLLIFTRYTDHFVMKQVSILEKSELSVIMNNVDDLFASCTVPPNVAATMDQFVNIGGRFSCEDQSDVVGGAVFDQMFSAVEVRHGRILTLINLGDGINRFDSLLSHRVLHQVEFGHIY